MNTQEAVRALRAYAEGYAGNIRGMCALAADLIDTRVPRWISVEERLPEQWRYNDEDRTLINYLVYMPEYGVDVGNWINDAKMWLVMGLPAKVTHWMPLPEPPKEER